MHCCTSYPTSYSASCSTTHAATQSRYGGCSLHCQQQLLLQQLVHRQLAVHAAAGLPLTTAPSCTRAHAHNVKRLWCCIWVLVHCHIALQSRCLSYSWFQDTS